jgi:DNA-binding GntR family transcriptional regulator
MDIQAAAKTKVGKRKDFIKTEEVKDISRYNSLDKDFATLIMSQCTMIILAQSIR